MKKRILSLALVLMLCLGMSVPALAADSATVGQVNTISLGSDILAVVDTNGVLWISDPNYQNLGLENRGTSPVFTKIMENVRTVSCGLWEHAVVKTDGSCGLLNIVTMIKIITILNALLLKNHGWSSFCQCV